jgi:protease I
MDVQMKKVLIPLPTYGFDPTEAAIPWKLLLAHDFQVVFATPEGRKASADRRMLTGESFGILKNMFQARRDAIDAYHEMEESDSFCNPLKYIDVHEKEFDGLLLPGGHDKSVKEYLESKVLQDLVAAFFIAKKPVGAICHAVILPARSINPETGKSVLHNYKTTALQKSQELLGYKLTRLWLGDYLLTYPDCTVEDEIRAVLANDEHFIEGPISVMRDSFDNPGRGFVVRDRNYVSARWYGDAYRFAFEFIQVMQELDR